MKVSKVIIFLSVLFIFILPGGTLFAAGGQQRTATPSGITPLTIATPQSAFVTDYKDNHLTRHMERMHNVDLEFLLLPTTASDIFTRFSLMVATNDLPDILMTSALSWAQILDYGSNGIFIPLNRYLEDPAMAPNYAAIPVEDRNAIHSSSSSADGNIYVFVEWSVNPWNTTPSRKYINKAWLDRLGLNVPATTADLRSVLLAFRDRDPNGNGRRDEIGVYGRFEGTYGEDIITALLNSFVYFNKGRLALDASGNTVIAPFIDPAFRRGLAYINDLYREGVLSASIFTDDGTVYRGVLNSDPPIVGFASSGSLGNWPDAANNANFHEMALIAPLTGPDGVSYTPFIIPIAGPRAMITSAGRNQNTAFRFLESFYNRDIALISRWGEEGVDWTRDPAELSRFTNAYINIGMFPSVIVAVLQNRWGTPQNSHWSLPNPAYFSPEMILGTQGNYLRDIPVPPPDGPVASLHYQLYTGRHPTMILPDLKYNLADAERLAMPVTDITDYLNQSIAEFVTGARDINNDAVWNTYLNNLNNMGLQQWIQISQATYNRQR